MTDLHKKIELLAKQAHKSAPTIAKLSSAQKNQVLATLASELIKRSDSIQKENKKDLLKAKHLKLSAAIMDRLTLTPKRIEEMAQGLREVISLPDPVGQVAKEWTRPNGLHISRVRIPLGVIGIIYESRPNVTIDAASLCLKSGNAVVLRGGSEAIQSNKILVKIIQTALKQNHVDSNIVQIVDTTDRKAMEYLVQQTQSIDLIIPRGGESLMKWIVEHSKIPVIKHDKGVCHIFVDEFAKTESAEKIALNAKIQRPGVCNAMETLLVHEKVASSFLPRMIKKFREAGVEVRGDEKVLRIVPGVKRATEKDWPTEYLDLIIAIKVVPNLEAAITHIQKYGSNHTEAIVTEDSARAEEFLNRLDSSVVLWNASTRFNDGGQLGLGAEIGISTTKMHAFGPMGLEELTTTKFVVKGSGQVRQ